MKIKKEDYHEDFQNMKKKNVVRGWWKNLWEINKK